MTNKFNILLNTQRNGDKLTGYCNLSPVKVTLSKTLLKDLKRWPTTWSSANHQLDLLHETTEDPIVELWTQRKITRNGGNHLRMSTIPLCQAKTYMAALRRYNTTLDFEAPHLKLFFLDMYSAPTLACRLKTEGVLKVSRNCCDLQGG